MAQIERRAGTLPAARLSHPSAQAAVRRCAAKLGACALIVVGAAQLLGPTPAAFAWSCDTWVQWGSAAGNVFDGTDRWDSYKGHGGNDVIRGNGGRDCLWGNAGYDDLSGGSSRDKLYGGDGQDGLAGDSGDDELHGGTGNDNLAGSSGDDVLKGEAGWDTIHAGSGEDSIWAGTGRDIVYAGDSAADYVNCGAGSLDQAYVDAVDTVVGCEDEQPYEQLPGPDD